MLYRALNRATTGPVITWFYSNPHFSITLCILPSFGDLSQMSSLTPPSPLNRHFHHATGGAVTHDRYRHKSVNIDALSPSSLQRPSIFVSQHRVSPTDHLLKVPFNLDSLGKVDLDLANHKINFSNTWSLVFK